MAGLIICLQTVDFYECVVSLKTPEGFQAIIYGLALTTWIHTCDECDNTVIQTSVCNVVQQFY